jgi:hypothetical protein
MRYVYTRSIIYFVVMALLFTGIGVALHQYGKHVDARRVTSDDPTFPGKVDPYDTSATSALPATVAEYNRVSGEWQIGAFVVAVVLVSAVVGGVKIARWGWRHRSHSGIH